MTVEEILAHKDFLNNRVNDSQSKYNSYVAAHKTSLGMVKDEIKETEAYKVLYWQLAVDIGALRHFNSVFANRPDVKKSTIARRFKA